MQLIIHLNEKGIIKVDIESGPDERQHAHSLFQALRPHLEKLDIAAKAAGREMGGGEDQAA